MIKKNDVVKITKLKTEILILNANNFIKILNMLFLDTTEQELKRKV